MVFEEIGRALKGIAITSAGAALIYVGTTLDIPKKYKAIPTIIGLGVAGYGVYTVASELGKKVEIPDENVFIRDFDITKIEGQFNWWLGNITIIVHYRITNDTGKTLLLKMFREYYDPDGKLWTGLGGSGRVESNFVLEPGTTYEWASRDITLNLFSKQGIWTVKAWIEHPTVSKTISDVKERQFEYKVI